MRQIEGAVSRASTIFHFFGGEPKVRPYLGMAFE